MHDFDHIDAAIAAASADLAEARMLADMDGLDHFWKSIIRQRKAALAKLQAALADMVKAGAAA